MYTSREWLLTNVPIILLAASLTITQSDVRHAGVKTEYPQKLADGRRRCLSCGCKGWTDGDRDSDSGLTERIQRIQDREGKGK